MVNGVNVISVIDEFVCLQKIYDINIQVLFFIEISLLLWVMVKGLIFYQLCIKLILMFFIVLQV